jgi:hypothetical protein
VALEAAVVAVVAAVFWVEQVDMDSFARGVVS